jgi:hypothetical protein
VAPTVTINQAAAQADPTGTSPITFDVVFSEAVSDFVTGDVNLSASTAGGTLIGTVTGAGTTYTVAVSGMTGDGTVIASIDAGVATGDGSALGNAASTSTDNTVTFSTAPVSLISNLTVASGRAYQVVDSPPGLQGGDLVYIDRTFTVTSVPALVAGQTYIRTANDDKFATTAAFLTFEVNQPVTVYVAYDSRIPTKPAWLVSDFTDTGEDLGLSSPPADPFDLFARDVSAGLVTLGGNTGGFNMYSVIVKPQGPP